MEGDGQAAGPYQDPAPMGKGGLLHQHINVQEWGETQGG